MEAATHNALVSQLGVWLTEHKGELGALGRQYLLVEDQVADGDVIKEFDHVIQTAGADLRVEVVPWDRLLGFCHTPLLCVGRRDSMFTAYARMKTEFNHMGKLPEIWEI